MQIPNLLYCACAFILCVPTCVPAGLNALRAQEAGKPVVVEPVVAAPASGGYRVVGTVQPLRTSTIGSAVAGRVGQVFVNQGDQVREGDELARLRTESLEIELAAANAELDLYRQKLTELRNGTRQEEIAEAEANALGAQAAWEGAKSRLQRVLKLSVTRAAIDADIDDAQERANYTKYTHDATRALLEKLKQGPRPEQIAQAQAQVELQLQKVRLIEDRISKHTLRAPFDGFISEEYTEVGAWISSGDPIAQVIQLNEVEIVAPAPAEIAVKLHRGDTIRIEFPDLPDKLITGNIRRVVPVAEARSRTFPVLIQARNEIRDGSPLLLSGMLARVALPVGKQRVLPLVPKDALVLNESEQSVFIIDASGKSGSGIARRVSVKLGVASNNLIQVEGDIASGDLVVIDGNERLADGDKVQFAQKP